MNQKLLALTTGLLTFTISQTGITLKAKETVPRKENPVVMQIEKKTISPYQKIIATNAQKHVTTAHGHRSELFVYFKGNETFTAALARMATEDPTFRTTAEAFLRMVQANYRSTVALSKASKIQSGVVEDQMDDKDIHKLLTMLQGMDGRTKQSTKVQAQTSLAASPYPDLGGCVRYEDLHRIDAPNPNTYPVCGYPQSNFGYRRWVMNEAIGLYELDDDGYIEIADKFTTRFTITARADYAQIDAFSTYLPKKTNSLMGPHLDVYGISNSVINGSRVNEGLILKPGKTQSFYLSYEYPQNGGIITIAPGLRAVGELDGSHVGDFGKTHDAHCLKPKEDCVFEHD